VFVVVDLIFVNVAFNLHLYVRMFVVLGSMVALLAVVAVEDSDFHS